MLYPYIVLLFQIYIYAVFVFGLGLGNHNSKLEVGGAMRGRTPGKLKRELLNEAWIFFGTIKSVNNDYIKVCKLDG